MSLIKSFEELSPQELYDILKLRAEVFIIEQQCLFMDIDQKDPFCYHLMIKQNNDLVAYARLVPPGLIYEECSIGRVVTSTGARGTGAGKKLMHEAIAGCEHRFGKVIRIGAQLYLKKFYENFGFETAGEVYLEDGIEHIIMVRS